MRTIMAAALVVATALAIISAQPAAAATTASSQSPPTTVGSIGLRLLDEPTSASDDPRARLYIVDNLAPGAVVQRRIEISNSTTSLLHAILYAAAASIANGAFVGAGGHTTNDLSAWTSVAPSAVDVPAGSTMTGTVTITVPSDAATGERYGAVWAEVDATPSGDISQVSRVGIREYISVGAGAAPASNFTIASMTAQRARDGQPVVVAMVHNTGGRALDMSGALNLSAGPGGLRAGPFVAKLGTTLGIGDVEPVTITLDEQLPDGPWIADISLASGLLHRSSQATLTFPNTGTSSMVTISTRSSWPHWLIFMVLGLALLLAVVVGLLVSLTRLRHAKGVAAAHRRARVRPH